LKITNINQAPGVHVCNPSYSGGRNQEDCGLKLAWANSSGANPTKRKKRKERKPLIS
jgi:hypothetical protein